MTRLHDVTHGHTADGAALTDQPPAASRLEQMATLSRVVSRTPFASATSLEAELVKLAWLRWAVGAVTLARTTPIVWAAAYYFPPTVGGVSEQALWGAALLAVIVLGTIGLAAPLTLGALLALYPRFDRMMNTATLGSTLLFLLLGLFLLSGAGVVRSVDARLLRGRGRLTGHLTWLYRATGVMSIEQLRALYFVYFLAFALINFGAMVFHAEDAAWRSGQTLAILFTSSYLCRFWETFRALESAAPSVLQVLSWAGAVGQTTFQIGMIPLIFLRWGSRLVIGWGALFFAMSLFLLQLSYLPLLEVAFWVALFYRLPLRDATTVRISAPVRDPRTAGVLVVTAFLALWAFVTLDMPYVERFTAFPGRESVKLVLADLGLDVPVVFNKDDLSMGDRWPVVYRVGDNGQKVLLPYHGLEGERLAWVKYVDLLYFGNSLGWRRTFGSPDPDTFFGPQGAGYRWLLELARFDHRRRGASRSEYEIHVFVTRGIDRGLPPDRRFQKALLRSMHIGCAGGGAEAMCR